MFRCRYTGLDAVIPVWMPLYRFGCHYTGLDAVIPVWVLKLSAQIKGELIQRNLLDILFKHNTRKWLSYRPYTRVFLLI